MLAQRMRATRGFLAKDFPAPPNSAPATKPRNSHSTVLADTAVDGLSCCTITAARLYASTATMSIIAPQIDARPGRTTAQRPSVNAATAHIALELARSAQDRQRRLGSEVEGTSTSPAITAIATSVLTSREDRLFTTDSARNVFTPSVCSSAYKGPISPNPRRDAEASGHFVVDKLDGRARDAAPVPVVVGRPRAGPPTSRGARRSPQRRLRRFRTGTAALR